MFKRIKEQYLLMAPPAFWLLVFFLVPAIIVVGYSFCTPKSDGGMSPVFTLENYRQVFQGLYLSVLGKSFGYALLTTLFTLALAFPMAYYMAFASRRMKMLLLFLIILPFWTNFLIRMFSIMILLGDNGLINTILVSTGIVDQPVKLMNNSLGMYVGFVYWNLPFMILPIFSSLDRMDVSLLEASLDLGASRWQTFLKITLPYAVPGLVAGIIFVFIPTLGNFIIPEFLGGTQNTMIGNLITTQYLQARNGPFGSALSTVLIFVVMLFIVLYIRFFDPTKSKNNIQF
ncbi:MAG TPA: ABC transporter permease [Prolixibacteraceae bacterium]|nr:ABC transporter permease [Prolixibacteraceae bacterium]